MVRILSFQENQFFGKYSPESIKGIMGGSDRMAAVKAVVEAAGGTVNLVQHLNLFIKRQMQLRGPRSKKQ